MLTGTVLSISQGDKFTDRIRYKELQPEKKKGFLTSDFNKRDEFSNTVRTAQYRELLDVRRSLNLSVSVLCFVYFSSTPILHTSADRLQLV